LQKALSCPLIARPCTAAIRTTRNSWTWHLGKAACLLIEDEARWRWARKALWFGVHICPARVGRDSGKWDHERKCRFGADRNFLGMDVRTAQVKRLDD